MVVCTCVMFGSLVRRSRSSDDDDHISSYREYNDVMSKEGLVQVLVRNAQNLQNVERFGYSDPHVVLELEGEISRQGHVICVIGNHIAYFCQVSFFIRQV